MKFARIIMLLWVMVVVASCGGNPPLNTANLNPSTLTIRFNGFIPSSENNFLPLQIVENGIAMFNSRGEGLEPNFYIMIPVRFSSYGSVIVSEILFRDGNLYGRSSYDNRWIAYPSSIGAINNLFQDSPLESFYQGFIFNASNFGLNLSEDMQDWQFVADETINGMNTQHYRRTFDATSVLFWSILQNYTQYDSMQVHYDMWLGDGHPQQFTARLDYTYSNRTDTIKIDMTFDYQSLVNIPTP